MGYFRKCFMNRFTLALIIFNFYFFAFPSLKGTGFCLCIGFLLGLLDAIINL